MKASDIWIARKLLDRRVGLLNDLDQLVDAANGVYIQLINTETGDEVGSFGGEDDADIVAAIRIAMADRLRGEVLKIEAALAGLGVTDLDDVREPDGGDEDAEAA